MKISPNSVIGRCPGVPCAKRCKFAPLFSTTSKMLLPQPPFFHAFALLPGGGIPPHPRNPRHLTNCSQLSLHFGSLCFQAFTNCPIRNSFLLIALQQWGGWQGAVSFLPSAFCLGCFSLLSFWAWASQDSPCILPGRWLTLQIGVKLGRSALSTRDPGATQTAAAPGEVGIYAATTNWGDSIWLQRSGRDTSPLV